MVHYQVIILDLKFLNISADTLTITFQQKNFPPISKPQWQSSQDILSIWGFKAKT